MTGSIVAHPLVARTRVKLRALASGLVVLFALPVGLAAQQGAAEAPLVPLMDKVTGPFQRPVDTRSERAQAYFNQGIQMMYAFTYPVAVRSFEQAEREDPNCAMCYWGEAHARGPFINSLMTESNARPAYDAAQKALSMIDQTDDPIEKALIRAEALRYAEEHDPDTRASLDSIYSQAMSDVYRAYPNDLDVGTLYAESLMLLNTQRWTYNVDDPFVQSFHSVLENVLAQDINHPGACHLYIHATEATSSAYKAEACADLLMNAIPGASHINHMPSHTYNVIGRWDKAVRANVKAWLSDEKTEIGEGVSYAGTHNLHMLFYAASMGGQSSLAMNASRAYAEQVPGGVFYQAMVLNRFGKFADVLRLPTVSDDQPLQQGLWEFSRGYAHLRAGSRDSANYYLARVEDKASSLPDDVQMRNHTAHDLLTITGDILHGEVLRADGDLNGAIARFEEAVRVHDSLRYDEPEPLNFSARHWLGDALLEAGRYADAEQVYRDALEQHPDNGWSLFGLEKAIRQQGRDAEADQVRTEFDRAWERADVWLSRSIF